MPTSRAVTRGVEVEVESRYDVERSDPSVGRWFFTYRVRITNHGDATVQLLTRHWVITDAHGHIEEVQGPGVVGQQPVLAPGQSHLYGSACPLGTPFGTMQGSYQVVTDSGESFDAEIAPFSLSAPYGLN